VTASTRAFFERGKLLKQQSRARVTSRTARSSGSRPTSRSSRSTCWQEEFLDHRLKYYAFLNAGLTLVYNGKAVKSKEGLADLLRLEMGQEQPIYEVMHCRVDRLEFAFTHTHNYGENYYSFVNGQYTNDGGTHQSAFREGVLKGVNEFFNAEFAGEDVRDGMVGAIAVKVQDPVFESQTKNKLGTTSVRPWIVKEVREQVVFWLHKHKEAAEASASRR
jgi:topoisomerase-4 subunit B